MRLKTFNIYSAIIYIGYALLVTKTKLFSGLDTVIIKMVKMLPIEFISKTFSTIFDPKLILIYLLILCCYWLLFKKDLSGAIILGLYTVLGFAINYILKDGLQRARPIGHLASDNGFSFPSGHSFGVVLLMGAILLTFFMAKNTLIKTIAVVIIILVGLARIYMGAHYPTDVIGGIALGYLIYQNMKRTSLGYDYTK